MAHRSRRSGIGAKLRFAVLKRDGFRCVYCGRTSKEAKLNVDHIVPVALGGTNDRLNLVTSCAECNSGKSCDRLPKTVEQRIMAVVSERERLLGEKKAKKTGVKFNRELYESVLSDESVSTLLASYVDRSILASK